MWVFRMRVLNVANAGSLVVGVLISRPLVVAALPLYAQQVLGSGAVVAGLALAAMTIGCPIAAATAGRFYLTLGFRATFLMGSAFALVGALLLLTVNGGDDSSVPILALPWP